MAQVVPGFYPINISYFKCLTESFCTIFEKVEDKHEILVAYGGAVEAKKIDERIAAGVENLYVSKKYRLRFVIEIT